MKKNITIKALLLLVLSSVLLLLVPSSFADSPVDTNFISLTSTNLFSASNSGESSTTYVFDFHFCGGLSPTWCGVLLPFPVLASSLCRVSVLFPDLSWVHQNLSIDPFPPRFYNYLRFRVFLYNNYNYLAIQFYDSALDEIVVVYVSPIESLDSSFDYSGSLTVRLFQTMTPDEIVDEYSGLVYDNAYDEGREEGYDEGYFNGSDDGFVDGVSIGYNNGYNNGYDVGFNEGYDEGYDINLNQSNLGIMPILTSTFQGLNQFLNIKIFNNITFGMIVAIPLIFGVIAFILGGIKKKDD